MRKYVRVFAILAGCVLALGAWTALQGQASDNALPGATYLTTITDANTGAFSSRSLINFHADHSLIVVDSSQGGPGVQFGDQLGTWSAGPGSTVSALTLNFSFPNAGMARADYTFTTINAQEVSGTITLSVFPLNGNPLTGPGTVVGHFNFTGQRVPAP